MRVPHAIGLHSGPSHTSGTVEHAVSSRGSPMRRRPEERKPRRRAAGTNRRSASPVEQRASDHAVLERLLELSSRLATQEALPTLLQAVIDAAIDLTGAQKRTLQLYDHASHS